ncbi:hypothetical protein [Photobacterium kishitanii]|uniref:hypothetical protein n=1 Tax=Photobacterium kishitanii TaxID=318456 RepID=UPI0027389CAA|nr:hypothetical protein [Photobacterium kishitanii]
MKKIYIFIPSFVGGGAEVVAVNLFKEFKEKFKGKFDVKIITFDFHGDLKYLVSSDDVLEIKRNKNKFINVIKGFFF